MIKKLYNNPAILFLVAGNLYCIWYYQKYPDGFATVVWIYWFQSMIIGLFNFIQLLSYRNVTRNQIQTDNSQGESRGCSAWFFLFHYGTFHLVYFIILLFKFNVFSVSRMVLLVGIAVFLLESILNFRREKANEKAVQVDIGILFFLPYLRIFPMHLMILLPTLIGWPPSLLFLVLKMGADLLSFALYHFIYRRQGTVS